jgi:hypothetical protein
MTDVVLARVERRLLASHDLTSTGTTGLTIVNNDAEGQVETSSEFESRRLAQVKHFHYRFLNHNIQWLTGRNNRVKPVW